MKTLLCGVFCLLCLLGKGYCIEGWREIAAVDGEFMVSFPMQPQHVKDRMFLPTVNSWMDYEIYLSILQPKAIFLLLVASYPKKIRPEQVSACLESFLKGMASRNADNQVIFADINEINGKKSLEFFLRSSTAFFRGKIFMEKGKLYLLAVESRDEKEIESLFYPFSESFRMK